MNRTSVTSLADNSLPATQGTGLRTAPPGVREESRATNEGPWSRELVKEIAMDIGKEIAAYIEVMYPKAVTATSSTFLLSVRNSVYNEIMAAIDVNDQGQIIARLQERKKFRRWWKAAYKKIRETASVTPPDRTGS